MQLSSSGQKNMIKELPSVALALPSTSQTEVSLNTVSGGMSQKAGANDASARKSSKKKKKKKKKTKKQSKGDVKNPCEVNSPLNSCENTDSGSNLPIPLEKNGLSVSKQPNSKQLQHSQVECGFVNDTNNLDVSCKNLNDTMPTELDAIAGSNRQISVSVDQLRNIDREPDLSSPLDIKTLKLEPGYAGMNSYSSRGQSEMKNVKHCHSDHRSPALKYQEDMLESGHDHAVTFAGKNLGYSKSTDENENDKRPTFSVRKPESRLDASELGAYKSSMNGHVKLREASQNNAKFGLDDTLLRESHTNRVMNNTKTEFERRDHVDTRVKSNRDGFWTRRTSEGPESSSYRSRVNQRSFNGSTVGESMSSLPFWRHQAVDLQRTAHPWSKPRRDEWITGRGAMPSTRQVKNISSWEVPDLRQSGTNRGFGHNWESYVAAEESFPQVQKGSSTAQRQNWGKRYEMSPRKRLPEDASKAGHSSRELYPISSHERPQQITKDCLVESIPSENSVNVVLNPPTLSSSVVPSVPSARLDMHSNPLTIFSDIDQSGATCMGQDIVKNLTEEAALPVDCKEITSSILQSNDAINCRESRFGVKDATGSSRFQPLRRPVIDHVCNIVHAIRASCESRVVYEQVSRGVGSPLCEFEKFANAVAPMLRIPETSTQHDESSGSLCMNAATGSCKNMCLQQLADVPLNALWEWYEEPSCFGVKVKLRESRDNVSCEYQAFFVPFLSGIQLFGWKNKDKTNYEETDGNQNADDLLNRSSPGVPILSILLPKSTSEHGVRASMLRQNDGNDIENSELGSISNRVAHCDYDVELLYEFFEGESPPQRMPLAEKIVQLAGASCDGGDACLLTSVKIGEVHPSSWFAVAWYPIYRIPDGTFRSTFLTYHSLSSLQQSMPTNSGQSSVNNRVTLPMVGYISYNAQAKDWFSLASDHSSKTHHTSGLFDANPAEVLQDHLTKLDAAAIVMARGCSDNLSGFKHLDYNFFQTRRK